jgi:hypothetical protein
MPYSRGGDIATLLAGLSNDGRGQSFIEDGLMVGRC